MKVSLTSISKWYQKKIYKSFGGPHTYINIDMHLIKNGPNKIRFKTKKIYLKKVDFCELQ